MISDILTDPKARSRVFGPNPLGMNIPGVKTATKTGTTDNGQGKAKDNWMLSYSPRVAAGVWVGRHDGKALTGISTAVPGSVVNDFMSRAHKEVYQPEGSWKANDWFQKPTGIQTLTINGRTDIYPSWFQKPQNADGVKMTFDKVSKKKATNCTPDAAKIELTVQSFEDPVSKKKTMSAPDGYDANADDDKHKCDDAKPFVTLSTDKIGPGKYRFTATVNQGTFALQTLEFKVDGQVVSSQAASSGATFTTEYTFTSAGDKNVSATVTDQGYYDATMTKTVPATLSDNGNGGGFTPPRRNRLVGF
jgi:penicillin-binding protein 1A